MYLFERKTTSGVGVDQRPTSTPLFVGRDVFVVERAIRRVIASTNGPVTVVAAEWTCLSVSVPECQRDITLRAEFREGIQSGLGIGDAT